MEYYVIAAVLTLLSIVNTIVLAVISHYVRQSNRFKDELEGALKERVCNLEKDTKEISRWIEYQKGFTNGRKNK